MHHITVISTALPDCPTEHLCCASVAAQRGVKVDHIYIVKPECAATENIYRAVMDLPPDRIVALVDGDDWLATDDALEFVARFYDLGAWVTYGSYMLNIGRPMSDGRPGHCAPLRDAPIRKQPWVASHLKTFRAGLLQKVASTDLRDSNSAAWLTRCVDLAIMFPMIELAGHDRVQFVERITYVYNFSASWERHATSDELNDQMRVETMLRTRHPYERLEKAPW